MTNTDSNSIFHNPEIRLERVRYAGMGNTCDGRGRKTASSRGYNAERLASATLDEYRLYRNSGSDSWYDTHIFQSSSSESIWVETKSCVQRYPSEQYGRFRIWKRNHDELVNRITDLSLNSSHAEPVAIYFFVVYSVRRGREMEIGKMAVPAEMVDSVLDRWSIMNHSSMGISEYRDISWNHLLTQLEVSREEFKSANAIDLTSGKLIL